MFSEIEISNNPGTSELEFFLHQVKNFLEQTVESDQFAWLWTGNQPLRELAIQSFNQNILDGAGFELGEKIRDIPDKAIYQHGLSGLALAFKLRVIQAVEGQMNQFSIRDWFKKMVDAIDALLDSLIDAAGGAGGVIKEFKDAISALA